MSQSADEGGEEAGCSSVPSPLSESGFTQGQPAEAGIPSDEEINEMLARPNVLLDLTRDQEVEAFCKIDGERVQWEEGVLGPHLDHGAR